MRTSQAEKAPPTLKQGQGAALVPYTTEKEEKEITVSADKE
jgi:hypothetical protein